MAQRRSRRGSGSVYQDGKRPGRWVGEITIDGKRRRVYGRTKTEASAALKALASKIDTGQPIPDRQVTVAGIVEEFIAKKLPNLTNNGRPLTPSTVTVYEWAAGIVTAEIGKIRLADLTVHNVEAMLSRAVNGDRQLSKSSCQKLKGKLCQFIEFAEIRYGLQRNVARLAEIPAKAAPRVDRNALGVDDARKLLAALRDERNGAMHGLCLMLGLRPGEAAGLYWEDLDLDGQPPSVNVTRGVRLDHGRAVMSDDLKTGGSKRTIQLTPDLVAWLAEHRLAQTKERLASKRWLDDRLVFATPTGHVMDPKRNRKLLAEVCEKAGVPKVRPNELRHSCASLLADQGIPNELIADLLGHTTTRMVEATYRHRLRPLVNVAALATWAEEGT